MWLQSRFFKFFLYTGISVHQVTPSRLKFDLNETIFITFVEVSYKMLYTKYLSARGYGF